MVARAWETVLHGKSVDHDADFRKIGINSNRAMAILRELWWETGVDLPVNVFYGAPTIRRMAAAIREGSALIAPDLVRLRDGDDKAPLFLFPGGAGVLFEFEDLVEALDWPGTIYGIAFSGLDGIGPSHDHFEPEVARSLEIIRRVQPTGPYRLAGYSIGGITALETARLMRQQGEQEVFLALLDTPQNDNAWPLRVWLGFIGRKMTKRLGKLLSSAPARLKKSSRATRGPAARPLAKRAIGPPRRGTQLGYRFRNPADPDYPYWSPYWVSYHPPNYARVAANAVRMKGFYVPRPYDGRVFFFTSARGEPLVCDPQAVWPKYLPHTDWISVPGDHYSILLGRRAAHLAAEITKRMRQVAPP